MRRSPCRYPLFKSQYTKVAHERFRRHIDLSECELTFTALQQLSTNPFRLPAVRASARAGFIHDDLREIGQRGRLLRDDEIGWHAGDWDINCRSVGIVLDNDYEHGWPGVAELNAIVQIIKTRYPGVSANRILGHREVNPRTSCPSENFKRQDGTGWRDELLTCLARKRKSRLN